MTAPNSKPAPRKLWLDDVRPAPEGWTWVTNFREFQDYIEACGVPDVISFDHDLSDQHYPTCAEDFTAPIDYEKYEEKTGYHCAKVLVEREEFPKLAYVHSFNPVGARNIAHLLGRHMQVVIRPYTGKEL